MRYLPIIKSVIYGNRKQFPLLIYQNSNNRCTFMITSINALKQIQNPFVYTEHPYNRIIACKLWSYVYTRGSASVFTEQFPVRDELSRRIWPPIVETQVREKRTEELM